LSEVSYVEHPLIKSGKVESRLYQQSILIETIDRNALVVLPTALGKTVIAVLLSAYYLQRNPEMKILMMAPTRPLVLQHRDSFAEMMNVEERSLVAITGKVDPKKRRMLWRGGRIFFSTPQIVKNDIERGILDLSEFSLLIFDEAHRAVKNYAYTFVARDYIRRSSFPVILALTASPGGDKERIRSVCESLFIERVVYRSEEDEDVKPYIPGIEIEWRRVRLPEEYREVSRILRSMIEERLSSLKNMGLIKKSPKHVTKSDLLSLGEELRELMNGGERSGWVYQAVVEQSACLSLFHALELLETQGMRQLRNFLLKLGDEEKRSYELITSHLSFSRLLELTEKSRSHPKIGELVKIVEEELSNETSRIIIFSQFRDTVNEIVETLRERGIRAERFVGQASRNSDSGLSQKEQIEVLRRFRSGEIRVIAATSIAEEGLDIPSTDLVIFYEPVPSEIRFIQRKGRTGRKRKGRVIILAAERTVDMGYFYSSLRRARRMRRIMRELNRELRQLKRGERPEVSRAEPERREIRRPAPVRFQVTLEDFAEKESQDPELLREVSRAERWILETLRREMQRGVGRISLGWIFREAREMGFSAEILKKAVKVLAERGEIYLPTWDTISIPVPESGIFDVLVERIYHGGATLLVNNSFRAKLMAEDFPLSSGLRKGERLRVRGELYRKDGVLCMRVREVIY